MPLFLNTQMIWDNTHRSGAVSEAVRKLQDGKWTITYTGLEQAIGNNGRARSAAKAARAATCCARSGGERSLQLGANNEQWERLPGIASSAMCWTRENWSARSPRPLGFHVATIYRLGPTAERVKAGLTVRFCSNT